MAIQGSTDPVESLLWRPASILSNQQLAELINLVFRGHASGQPQDLNAESFAQWVEGFYVHLEQSFIFLLPGESPAPVAFAFVALREGEPCDGGKEGHARLAGLGVLPLFQGRGIGWLALDIVINKMAAKGVKVLELECLSANQRGMNLYKSAGFETVRELTGWERDDEVTSQKKQELERWKRQQQLEDAGLQQDDGNSNEEEEKQPEVRERLQECSIQEISALVNKHGAEDLPWQAWGFHRSPTPQRAFHVNNEAYCVVAAPEEDEVAYRITCVFVPPEHRGKGATERLAKAMFAHFPHWRWTTFGTFPREYCEKLAARIGFVEKPQRKHYQMRLEVYTMPPFLADMFTLKAYDPVPPNRKEPVQQYSIPVSEPLPEVRKPLGD
jgi:ribosomal protein S18 acetylase RimI-like enzyme/predicted GNAT family acetyltransferase